MVRIVIAIQLILTSSFSYAHSEEINVVHVEFNNQESKLIKEERFFLVHKESLLLDMNLYEEMDNWETIIGPLKKETSDTVRSVKLSKIKGLDFKLRDRISFYNTQTKNINSYTVKNAVYLKLVKSPFEWEYIYDSFNLILTDPKTFHKFTDADHKMFESVAFKGESFKLKPGLMTYLELSRNTSKPKEFQDLLRYHLSLNGSAKKENNVAFSVKSLGDRSIFEFTDLKNSFKSYFLKTGNRNFLHWNDLRGDKGRIHLYGENVEGAELTLVYNWAGNYYFVILYEDTSKKYKVWHETGTSG